MLEKNLEIDGPEFRQVMGHFCTGVVVISSIVNGVPVGMTCQSFVSVSLVPPLILFCPSRTSTSWPLIKSAAAFCINVLAQNQLDIGNVFARSGGNKFEGVTWSLTEKGNPRIDGCLVNIDCTLEETHSAGDHELVIGRVQDLHLIHSGKPLLFYRGQFTSTTDEQRLI
jgi:3-hydroxy-9,10-secoandrosta-1,3,5(10)-triene-9,17-dione monooxygenase reductase component